MSDVNKNLGYLAMKFRGYDSAQDRFIVALEYEKEVNRLVLTKAWKEVPGPEDMLPDQWMPLSFYKHWKL
jgi:hypothetical protein